MIYVFDSSTLIDIFDHYYPGQFPSFWENFDNVISQSKLVSVREVFNEIDSRDDALSAWAKEHKDKLFPPSTSEELTIVRKIFEVEHFQMMIRTQERLQGKPVADPFVIAKAKIFDACVVTQEKFTENVAKIPNVCKHFGIPCFNLEGFMEKEKWIF